ncbi:TonB family protein [Rhodoblastus sp. 17X3]|uniref:energy transducer TonB family protein n=1 Tax=Rhodoblastus sp. 17X3 TaxID=3047026 RepID=UPI0024B78D9B|nr:TonB family protein [Rhodoblastus sp. 17X3]MDI9848959.1 TonB family protein [Rhodoblastus sp. 17X3]
MSVAGALSGGGPMLAAEPRDMVRPPWLRPLALLLILAFHSLMFVAVKGRPAALSPLDTVEVSLVPLGDAAEDQKKQEEVKPAEMAAQELPQEPPPPVQQAERVEPPPPPPQVAVPEAVPLPVEPPRPVAPPPPAVVEKKPPPKPVAARDDQRQKAREEHETAERRRKAQEARQELKRGAASGSTQASSMSPAAYSGLLAAEIRRRTFYPAAARAAGATGAVGVAFTVGPSGRVISQSITHSSGNPVLDAAARTTLSGIHTPPPPGGRFSTSTNIRFHFN